jgi:hypothetical protein
MKNAPSDIRAGLGLLLFAIILALAPYAPLSAQEGRAPQRDLGGYLNPDGTLNLEGASGRTLDASGWRVTTDSAGIPHFDRLLPTVADSTDTLSIDSLPPITQSLEGDEGWDDRFGMGGTTGIVYAVAVSGDNVYVGGRFGYVGGVAAHNIASWNRVTRRWSGLRGGVEGARSVVHALALAGNDLYIGGIFTSAGGVQANGVVRYNTRNGVWSPLDSGLSKVLWNHDPGLPSIIRGGDVYALAMHGGDLYAAGDFSYVNGDSAIRHIARWDGTSWSPLSADTIGQIYTMLVHDDDIYIAGKFDRIGSVPARNVARWSTADRRWYALGEGPNDSAHALAWHDGALYVGGSFTKAGGIDAGRIARWDGSAWSAVGAGFDGNVHTLASDGRILYAGGEFSAIQGRSTSCIARWNGSAWAPMGAGIGITDNALTQYLPPISDQIQHFALGVLDERDFQRGPEKLPFVWTIAVAGDGEIYAGGHFSTAGTVTSHHIIGWRDETFMAMSEDTLGSKSENGTDGAIYAVAVDGDDIYVGGDFTHAGRVLAPRVARWNRTTRLWSSLGSGVDGARSFVRALTVIDHDLYVGGFFDSVSGVAASGVARWSGGRWSALGEGVGGANPYVFALAGRGDDLYVGGSFELAGDIPAGGIARWGRSSGRWDTLGAGVSGRTSAHYVLALALGDSGLYVGGNFERAGSIVATGIARWDGATWLPLRGGVLNGMDGSVNALALDADGGLWAGGEFTHAGAASARYVARWKDGEWKGAGATGPNAPVYAVAVDSAGMIYAAGELTRADTGRVGHVARWDGKRWSAIGAGNINGANGFVRGLATVGSDLFCVGEFNVAGGHLARFIATWEGGAWSGLGADPKNGFDGRVQIVAARGEHLYVGGLFTSVGGMRAGNFAHWDGTRWLPMTPKFNGVVRAIAIDDNGGAYIGGEFSMVDGRPANGLVHWDGATWTTLGAGLGGGTPYVYALALRGNDLYVGGAFSTAGGLAARRIARWDIGAGRWSPLGEGAGGAGSFTYVTSLAIVGSDLIAGGIFPTMGGAAAQNVARWDGTSWSPVGAGLNNAVFALAVSPGGALYAGGNFQMSGESPVRRLARWDGSAWQSMGYMPNGDVYALSANDQDLFVVGSFVQVDVVRAKMARWDGAGWHYIGHGPYFDYNIGTPYSLAVTGSDLYVGGDFTVTGTSSAYYLGHWSRSGIASVEPAPGAIAPTDDPSSLLTRPNPFGEVTTIDFEMAKAGSVRVAVYNDLGEEVAELFGGHLPAGRRSIEWRPAGLPAGAYYCRVERDGGAITSRLILLEGR